MIVEEFSNQKLGHLSGVEAVRYAIEHGFEPIVDVFENHEGLHHGLGKWREDSYRCGEEILERLREWVREEWVYGDPFHRDKDNNEIGWNVFSDASLIGSHWATTIRVKDHDESDRGYTYWNYKIHIVTRTPGITITKRVTNRLSWEMHVWERFLHTQLMKVLEFTEDEDQSDEGRDVFS